MDVLENSMDPPKNRKEFDETRGNVLADKLPEIKDFPYNLKLSILGSGSLLGEEDIIGRNVHACSVKCNSSTGLLYYISKEKFLEMVGAQ
jgi:CRP-like cAMP-binding protein